MKQIKQDCMYCVDENGNVFSSFSNKYLKLSKSKTGYLVVNVRVGGLRQPVYVHRLVAEAFIPNPDNKPFVNHKDGNKENNTLLNLEWVTDQENKEHAIATGLMLTGEALPQSTLTNEDVHSICKLLISGMSCGKICTLFSVSRSTVLNIRSRRDWQHISCNYYWKTYTNKRNTRAKTCKDYPEGE